MTPLISVVIATYNGSRFLPQQLESVLNQTYSNLEIIIVDDCSTDKTVELIEEYKAKDQRISLFQNEKNLGYVRNFERGLSLAKGDFIAPCDQDDVWKKDKLQILFDNINGHDIIYCDSALIDEQGELTGIKLSAIKKLIDFDNPLNYAIGNTAAGHAMLIRKKIVDECFPFPTMIPHDYWLGFVATFYGELKFIDLPLVLYRQHSHNVFGVASKGLIREKKKQKRIHELASARERMQLLYEKCPEHLQEKKVFFELNESYKNYSLKNNFKRMILFFQYQKEILAYKRRSSFRRFLFCLKMFAKIV